MIIIEDDTLFFASGENEKELVDSWNYYFPNHFDWIRDCFEDDEYFYIIEPVKSVDQIFKIVSELNEIADMHIKIIMTNLELQNI